MRIKEKDVSFKAVRAGGPGGQNVNRRATKIQARVSIESLSLSEEEKKRLRDNIPPSYITKEGDIVVVNEEGRTQKENKSRALEIINRLVEEALKEAPERLPTKPKPSAKERRLKEKKKRSEKKKRRSKKTLDYLADID